MKALIKLVLGCAIGVASFLVAFFVPGINDALQRFELASWDLRQRLFAREPHPDIVLVVLDQDSLDWAASEDRQWKWVWPRVVYSPLLRFCQEAGVRAVGFDFLFTGSSEEGVDDDIGFRDAMESTRFVGALQPSTGRRVTESWPELAKDPASSLFSLDRDGYPPALIQQGFEFYCEDLISGPTMFGHVGRGPIDEDVVRHCFPVFFFGERPVPMLGLAVYLAADRDSEGQPVEHRWSLTSDRLQVDDVSLPILANGSTPLRFRRWNPDTEFTYPAYSASSVIQSGLNLMDGDTPLLSPEIFRDKYVLFAPSAPGLRDIHVTPLNPKSAGVEVHATLLDNLLRKDAFEVASNSSVMITTLFLSLILSVTSIFARSSRQVSLAAALVLPVPIALGMIGYPLGVWWPILGPGAAVLLSLIGGGLAYSSTEGRRRRFITNAFQHYLSPLVIENILKDPTKLKLGGERRELTIFFSDLEGFSTISEGLEPMQLTQLLNDYLTDMTDIILEEGGTLDKYEGDAIIAFWNAPLDQPDHALRGCRAALRCQRKLADRREEFAAETGAVLKMRIGMHTGQVVVGNMGSVNRFDYTVLGDSANLAARLEGANKRFGTYLMVSDATWNQAKAECPELVARPIGRIRVVGRATPVQVIEPLGYDGEVDPEYLAKFELALKLFDEKRWEEALKIFDSLPSDALFETYKKELRGVLEASKGEEEWDGVWQLTSK